MCSKAVKAKLVNTFCSIKLYSVHALVSIQERLSEKTYYRVQLLILLYDEISLYIQLVPYVLYHFCRMMYHVIIICICYWVSCAWIKHVILEWTTSLDTSSRTLFVRIWGCGSTERRTSSYVITSNCY